jgi:hypothetical protein
VPNSSTFCDLAYIPQRRASWTERLACDGQVKELMELLPLEQMSGTEIAASFISRRVQPC